jgi:hypothetical protein
MTQNATLKELAILSRGMGWLQRKVLEILQSKDRLFDTFEITATVFEIERDKHDNRWVTDAQHAAVRRTLAGLVRQNKALSLGRRWPDGRQRWANIQFDMRPDEFGSWRSDRRIAEAIGVSASTVHRARTKVRAERSAS